MNRIFGFLIGVVVGGMVGSTIALLMAPESGEQLRLQMRARGENFFDDVRHAILRLVNPVGKVVPGKIIVDGLRAAFPEIVIVDEDEAAGRNLWIKFIETGHGGFVPVRVETKDCYRSRIRFV